MPQPETSTLTWVLSQLAKPGRATAGFIGGSLADGGEEGVRRALLNLRGEREDDFDDVLAQEGMADTWDRRALGFAGDVVLDPLNAIPAGAVGRGLSKVAGLGGDALGGALRAVGAGGVVDGFRAVKDGVGKAFIPHYDLRVVPGYRDDRRLFASETRTLPNRVYEDIASRFTGTTPAEQEALSFALDSLEKTPLTGDRVQEILQSQRAAYDTLGQRQVDVGVLDPDSYKGLKGHYNPRYIRHDGQAPKLGGRSVSPTDKFAKERKTRSLEEAIELGAEKNAAVAALVRSIAGERSIQSAKFLRKTAQKYGVTEALPDHFPITDVVPEGALRALKIVEDGKPTVDLSTRFLPRAIAEDLKKVYTPQGETEPILQGVDKVMQMWRRGATVERPGFHITNLTGNIYNAALGGTRNPVRYLQAATSRPSEATARELAEKSPALREAAHAAGMDPVTYLTDWMRKHGMVAAGKGDTFGQGELSGAKTVDELGEILRQDLNPNKQATAWDIAATPWRTYRKGMEGLGNAIEGSSKRAVFYDNLAKGLSPEEATIRSKDVLFDYGELTNFERNYMRPLLPFYTFARKNLPLQVKSLVNAPEVPAFVAKGQDALEDMGEDRGTTTPMAERPEWFQEKAALPLPFGWTAGAKAYLDPMLPVNDLNRIPTPFGSKAEDSLRDWISGLNPLAKAPLELGMNKQLFNRLPVYDERLGLTEDLKRAPALFQLPGLRDVLPGKINQDNQLEIPAALAYAFENSLPFMANVGKAGQAYVSPEESSNPAGWLRFLGVPLSERTPEQQMQDRRGAFRKERGYTTALNQQEAMPENDPLQSERIQRLLAWLEMMEEPQDLAY